MHPKNTRTLHTFTDLNVVFDLVLKGNKRMDIDGLNVSIRRMECFAAKGVSCVQCGLSGNVIMVDEWPNGQIHVDLFRVYPNGGRTLMNIDHIIPKSKGGPNHISNYQPMCQPCNSKKGNKIPEKVLDAQPVLVSC